MNQVCRFHDAVVLTEIYDLSVYQSGELVFKLVLLAFTVEVVLNHSIQS